jgi:hypothetical protein
MTDENFKRALKTAVNIVESWPSWKQNSLLVTTMATTPAPRTPVSIDSSERSATSLESSESVRDQKRPTESKSNS